MTNKKLVMLINIEKYPVGPVNVRYTDLQGKQKTVEVFKGTPVTGLPDKILDCEDLKKAVKKKSLKTFTTTVIVPVKKTEVDSNDQANTGSGQPDGSSQPSGDDVGEEQTQVQDENTTPAPSTETKNKQGKGKNRKNK